MKNIFSRIEDSLLTFINCLFPSYDRSLTINIRKAKRIVETQRDWESHDGIGMINPDSSHARAAIQKMLNNTNRSIYILCHKLNKKIYEDSNTIRALNAAFERNRSLDVRVYLREKAPTDSIFFLSLLALGARVYENLESSEDESIKKILENKDYCFMDGYMVREETNEEEKTGNLRFADGKAVEKARAVFSEFEKEQEKGTISCVKIAIS